MKKYLSALLALCMTAMLSGCMCTVADTKLQSDGSGSVAVTFGFSERLVEICHLQDTVEKENFTSFSYGGKKYRGDTVTEAFSDPASFNAIMKNAAAEMKTNAGGLNPGTLALFRNASGDFTLTLTCDDSTGSTAEMERALRQTGEVSNAEISALREELVMRYEFTFPKDVCQTNGGKDGITVAGNKLSIDLTALSQGTYQFTTAQQSAQTSPAPETTPLPDRGTVYARTQKIDIDGKTVTFNTYAAVSSGGETNYVKLRDVAHALNGTAAQFDVGWDGDVLIVPHTAYTPNGSEMTTPFTGDRAYVKAASATKVDGAVVPFSAIYLTDDNGGGYTYYKLRDLGQVLGFNVSWSRDRGICIESDKPYTAD